VLLTTHRAEEMGKLADRVLELADGAPAAEPGLAQVLPLRAGQAAGGAR
jgi:hypothetical protein